MTFNATSPTIALAKASGLVEYYPLVSERPPIRRIFCPPDILAELNGGNPSRGFPSIDAITLLGTFIAGYTMNYSFLITKRHRKHIQIERLENLHEVWGLCLRRPGAGWRMLGRFLDKDIFVILIILNKNDTGNDYIPFAKQLEVIWDEYLGKKPPLTGDTIEDYMSGVHYNGDELSRRKSEKH